MRIFSRGEDKNEPRQNYLSVCVFALLVHLLKLIYSHRKKRNKIKTFFFIESQQPKKIISAETTALLHSFQPVKVGERDSADVSVNRTLIIFNNCVRSFNLLLIRFPSQLPL